MPVDSQYYQAEQGAEGASVPVARSLEGRWQKGVSGNPAGRPRGSRNQATRMAEALLDAASAMLTEKAIDPRTAGPGGPFRGGAGGGRRRLALLPRAHPGAAPLCPGRA